MKYSDTYFRGDKEDDAPGITLRELTDFVAAATAAGCPPDGLIQVLGANITLNPDGCYVRRISVPTAPLARS